MSSFSLRSILPLFLLSVVALGLTACDFSSPLEDVNLGLEIEDAEVSVGTVTTDVRMDRPTISTEQTTPDIGVQDIRDLHTVRLKTEFFSFSSSTASGPSKADARASGTLEVWVFFGSYPLPNMPITVTVDDDVITEINPSELNFGGAEYTVDEDGLNQLLDELGSDAPDLEAWEDATISEVEESINNALQAESSPFSVSVRVTDGDLSGSLSLNQFSIDATVTK